MALGALARQAWSPEHRLTTACWLLLATLALLLLSSAWQGPDIFSHLALGRAVLETGRPDPGDNLLAKQPAYLNYYWLFQAVLWGIHGLGGTAAVSVFFGALWCAILYLGARLAGLAARPQLGIPFALGALFILWNRFDPRPEVASYLLIALLLRWFTTWDFTARLGWRRLALVFAVEALWANMHAYFVFGPMLAAAFLVLAFLRGERRHGLAGPAKLVAASLAGSFLTPHGPAFWPLVLDLWRFQRSMRDSIAEFRPPVGEVLRLWTVKLFWVYWILSVLVALWLCVRRRSELVWPAGLAAIGLALGATSSRNLPLFLLFAAPAWRAAFSYPGPPLGARARRATISAGAILVLAACAWVGQGGFHRSLGSLSRVGGGLAPAAYPVRFVHWWREARAPGLRLFNGSREGAYLEYAAPEIRCYTDPRYVDVAMTREYFAALRDPAAFQALDQRWSFQAVLLSMDESAALVTALAMRPDWELAYADPHRAFLRRREAGVEAPGPPVRLRFYEGDDLSAPVNGRGAIEWTVLLVRTKRKDLLKEALRQFAGAPRVPSVVVQYGLGYGIQERDREIVDLARALHPRMIARTEEDRSIVERLMLQAGAFQRSGG